MPESSASATQLMAFLEDGKDIEVVNEAFKKTSISNSEIIKGGVKEAIEIFSHQRSPQYLIIDISKSDLPVSDLSRLSEVCEPGVNLIAVGKKNDVGLYRDLMQLGIIEYLVSPLFSEIVGRALKNMILGEDKGKRPQSRLGKIIAVTGARGGVGSTFMATNLAAILSSEKFHRVVIVDLDLHFGTVSLYLNLQPNYGLRTALEDPDRVDQTFLERLLTSVNQRLYALSSEEPLEESLNYRVDGIENLLKYLSKLFHYVIVDVPHYSSDITLAVFENSQLMLLITDPSLAGLRDSGKLIRLFGKEDVDHRIILVMNKVGASKKNEIQLSDFEEALNRKVDHVIPYDSIIPIECVNQGKTLVDENNPLARSLREIVSNIQGMQEPEKKPGGFERFWNKFKLK